MDNYKFFENTKCEWYPCHEVEKINCLFCFCPLHCYKKCGGNYTMLDNGWKDCSNCNVPHGNKGYDYIINKLIELKEERDG